MSRLRILHAAKFYPPVRGGMETVVSDLCQGTAREWTVSVVAAHTSGATTVDEVGGVEVVRAGTWGSAASVPLCPSYPWHMWRRDADCVVLHEPNPLASLALHARPPRRLVIWHHSDLVRPWWAPHTYGRVQRALYRRADCVIVSSPNLAASSPLVQAARRTRVVPFGIDLQRYRQPARRSPAVRAALAAATGPVVLFVGRFVYYKGVDVLLGAMARCQGTLVLVGDGPLEASLRARVHAAGMGDRVIFAGRTSDEDLRAWYQAADLFVLPSIARTEAFGVVQLEAMACGVPVVSTDLPTGVPWVNRDGETGLIARPGDAEALACAIQRLLTDHDLRARFGRNAAARAAALFSRERMVAAFRDVVETVVAAPEALDVRAAREDVA